MTSTSKNVYIDKLDNIVNKCNNAYHRTIKMKPINVKSNTYINSNKVINDKDHKFKIDDHVRIQNVKTFLQKDMFQIDLKKIIQLQKLKILFRGHLSLVILELKKLLESFTNKNCKKLQKTNQKEFRVEKVIKRKGDKLYVKWRLR